MSFAAFEDDDERTLLEKAEKLQSGFIGFATQDGGSLDAATYTRLRQEIMTAPTLAGKVPDFVRRCRDQGQFWQFIKNKFGSYRERREYIWNAFRPVLEFLETQDRTPGVAPITEALEGFDPENVKAAWQKALDRRAADPEGAITAARMLLETVCKHILVVATWKERQP
jgi:phage portal protein BeeE